MNLFMCFVLPSFLLSKSRGVDAVQGGGLRIRGDLRICFLACVFALHAFSVSALLVSTIIFVAQGSCEYAPHPQPPYGAGEILPALKLLCLPGF